MGTDADALEVESIESIRRSADGVDRHVVAAGDGDDPLVVLLHGFPDRFYGWRHRIEPLADAGYRVLVPDQRGYDLSGELDGLDAYRLGRHRRSDRRALGRAGRADGDAQLVSCDGPPTRRAAPRPRRGADADRVGREDPALVPELVDRSARYCDGARAERFPTRGHWLHMEAPAAVDELLLEHLDG